MPHLEVHAFEVGRPSEQEGCQHIGEVLLHAHALCQVCVPQPHRQREGDLPYEQAIHPPARLMLLSFLLRACEAICVGWEHAVSSMLDQADGF